MIKILITASFAITIKTLICVLTYIYSSYGDALENA